MAELTGAFVDGQVYRSVSSFAELPDQFNLVGRRRQLVERDRAAVRCVHRVTATEIGDVILAPAALP